MGLSNSQRYEVEEVPQWKIDHPTWQFDHVAAGKKAMATSNKLYSSNGETFGQRIGGSGGKRSRGGGKPFDHERAVYWASHRREVTAKD